MKAPGGMSNWWKETGLSTRASMFDETSKDQSYAEFQRFFNRVVCMSSVKVIPDPFQTWAKVQGHTQHHMAAGHTKASQDIKDKATLDDIEFSDILKATHHAYKTLFFTKDQMAILTTDNFPSAMFLCDFGAGKPQ